MWFGRLVDVGPRPGKDGDRVARKEGREGAAAKILFACKR